MNTFIISPLPGVDEFQGRNCELPVRRRGSLMIELVICGLLLGIVMSAIIPTLGWLVRERKTSQERQAAILEAGNLMERLSALGWDDLTPERAAQFKVSDSLARQLPEAKLAISIEADDSESAKRILIELKWEIAHGTPGPAVRLAAWMYRRGN